MGYNLYILFNALEISMNISSILGTKRHLPKHITGPASSLSQRPIHVNLSRPPKSSPPHSTTKKTFNQSMTPMMSGVCRRSFRDDTPSLARRCLSRVSGVVHLLKVCEEACWWIQVRDAIADQKVGQFMNICVTSGESETEIRSKFLSIAVSTMLPRAAGCRTSR